MFRSIRWRIAVGYVILIVAAMLSLALYLSGSVREWYLADLQGRLAHEASLIAESVLPRLSPAVPSEGLDALTRQYAGLLDARVTLIAADGTVLGESHEERAQMDNHLYRVEVLGALQTGQGSSIRFSRTVGYEMLYIAVPIHNVDRTVAVARLAVSLQEIGVNVSRLRLAIAAAALVTAGVAAVLALWIAEQTARPVRSLTGVVQGFAGGDLSARLLPTTGDEVGTLTAAFNQMADRLRTMITELTSEHSRLAAVLEHMADGVLMTDAAGSVTLINPAAVRLLGTGSGPVIGHSFAEAVRHHEIIELWQACRRRGEEHVETIEIDRRGPLLQVAVSPLRGVEPGSCVVIIQDLTQVHRLETVRRDFISNISHELRTPLSSLKALVDALRDGAVDDPAAAQRLLDQAETEVDALEQLIQELLELSRIESGQVPLHLAPTAVQDVVLPVVEHMRPQAERAQLHFTIDLPVDLPPILADAERIRQVVTNLVHNAVKFTPAGGSIAISASADAKEVTISVRDTGIGIPADILPRVFERFFKVDRSRTSQGAGLGLSIVKHIVQGHGGRVWVDSVEGHGSTFFFTVPKVEGSG
jgi:two-component system phosphate regulon sensor histidine kinase PhoR